MINTVNPVNLSTGARMSAFKRKSFRSVATVAIALTAMLGSTSHAEAGILGPSSNYLVQITPEARSTVESAIKKAGGRVDGQFKYAFDGFLVNLPDMLIPLLKKIPNILTVEKDMPVSGLDIQQNQTPTPSWGLDRVDQREKISTATGYQGAYGYRSAGKGATIYIGDTGIYSHEDLAGRISTSGFSGIADGNGTVDCNGHGTHVATTAAGSKYGIAKSATVVPVRILNCTGSGTYATVIAGLDWILSPLNTNSKSQAVLNLSIGGGASSAINDAILRLTNAGITVVAAAGNESTDACTRSPASAPSAITVGATTNLDARASFSNFGPCVDIFAPGSGITGGWFTSASATNTISGTSMATPHVAGAAAVFLGLNPSASVAQVADALKNESTKGAITNIDATTVNNFLYVSPTDGGPAIVEPTAIVNTITGITHLQATANVEINPNNAPTTASIQYGSDQTFASIIKTINLTPTSLTGGSSVAISATLDGLQPSTTHFFRVIATNEAGTFTSPVGSFKSLAPPVSAPTPVTKPASKVTGWSATLNGTMNANNGATSVSFVYGTDPTFTTNTLTGLPVTQTVSGNTAVAVSLDISFLDPKTVYYYRLVGSNSAASVTSQVESFTTAAVIGALPIVETIRPADGISVPQTTVTGLVNPNGQTTSVRFVWGPDQSLTVGQRIIDLPNKYTGNETVTVTADIVNPLPGARYYYRFEATNAAGVSKPVPLTNVTNPVTPVIGRTFGSAQTQTSLQFNTSVNPGGSNSRVSFIYGTDPKLETGTSTINGDPFAMVVALSFSVKAAVTGLKPDTTYYFRTKVFAYTGPLTDVGGVLLGPIASIQTLAPVRTPQTITFNLPATRAFIGAPTLLTATASSGLPITYSTTTPTICRIQSTETATYLLAADPVPNVAAAMCNVTASQAGNETYAPAVGLGRTITFAKTAQRISFATPSNKEMNMLNQLSITTPSALPITVTSTTPNTCSIITNPNGTWAAQVNPAVTGDTSVCTITAAQAGNDEWAPAITETRSFTWTRSFVTLRNTYAGAVTAAGTNLDTVILDRSSSVLSESSTGTTAITYISLTPRVCSVDSANFIGSSTAHTRAVIKSLWNGVCQLTITYAGSGQVKSATTTYAVTVTGMTTPETGANAAQTITFAQPSASSIASEALLTVSATSKLDVTVVSTTPNVCVVEKNSAGKYVAKPVAGLAGDSNICQLTASQAGDGRWAAAANVSRSLTFKRITQTITFALPSTRYYGGAPTALTATSTSGLPITYSTTTPTVCKITQGDSGSLLSYIETFSASNTATCSVVGSQAGNDTYSAAPNVTRAVTWMKESTTTKGTLSGAISITGATLNLLVTSTSQPSLNERNAGSAPLTVTSKTPNLCKVETPEYVGSSTVHTKVVVKALWNGSCQLTVGFAGNSYWLASNTVITASINGVTTPQPGANVAQSISLTTPTAIGFAQTAILAPRATSGLGVTLTTTTPNVCTVTASGASYNVKGAAGAKGDGNICTLQATQPGNEGWLAAPALTRNITINKANMTVRLSRWSSSLTGKTPALFVAGVAYIDGPSNGALNSLGDLLTFTNSTPAVCSVTNVGPYATTSGTYTQATITGITNGTCSVSMKFAATDTQNETVLARTVTITGIK